MTEGRPRRFSQHFELLDEAEERGAPQGAERDAWSDRCCGLASLRTVLDAHGLVVPTQTALLRRSVDVGAIGEAGMIHRKLVELAADHGLDGRAVSAPDVAVLARIADDGYPSIVSVSHQLPDDGRRGGHLVVLTGTDTAAADGVRFVDPSRWGRTHDRVPRTRLEASYSGRAVLLWPADGVRVPSAVASFLETEG